MDNRRWKKKRKNDFDINEYSKATVDRKASFRAKVNMRSLSDDQIERYLNDPLQNVEAIGNSISVLSKTNGAMSNLLRYFSSLPTYNYSIYPMGDSKSGFNVNMDLEEYLTVASGIEKYNIKHFLPYFFESTMINGMSFFYEIIDSKGVYYLELPLSMCRISGIENGVYRVLMNINKIGKEILDIPNFPKEIVRAYETPKSERVSAQWYDKDWYLLSNKAIAFCFDPSVIINGGVAVSPLLPVLSDTFQLQKAKGNVDIKDKIDTVKVIHGEIQLDKNAKVPMTSKEAGQWNKILTSAMPDGISVAVTPFKLENISLSGAASGKAYDTVKDSLKQLYRSAGIGGLLFGDETNSYKVLEYNIKKDAMWIYSKAFPVFESYYNRVLSNIKVKSESSWKIKLLRQTNLTLDKDVSLYKDAITLGGSRLDYLASIGMSPMEIYTKLNLEQNVLHIDEIMLPKPTSYTMKGVEGNGAIGRPETEEPEEDTIRLSES